MIVKACQRCSSTFGNNNEVVNATQLKTIAGKIKHLTSLRYQLRPRVSFTN
jgi:hypothetical protein